MTTWGYAHHRTVAKLQLINPFNIIKGLINMLQHVSIDNIIDHSQLLLYCYYYNYQGTIYYASSQILDTS